MRRLLKKPQLYLILILLIASVLRFYRLPEYVQFLGDEGRDALVVKNMIVDHRFTLLGPSASVGGFYIGPLYYYFMLPFLWIWQLDPVGPAVMSALFGLSTVVLIWLLARGFWNTKVAVTCALLLALSPKMTYISRFSWNPNPTPFFALLTILLLFFATKRRPLLLSFLSGISLGIMQELHYTNLIFVPIVGLCIFALFPLKKAIHVSLTTGLGFLLGNSPYLLFEIRHDFPNLRSVLEFTTRGQGAVISPRSMNLLWLGNDMMRRTYETVFGFSGVVLNIIYALSVGGFVIWVLQNIRSKLHRPQIVTLLIWIIVGALGIGLYRGQLLDHYFGFLYPLPFMIVALSLGLLLQKKLALPIVITAVVVILFLEVKNMYFWQPPNNLINQTKAVDHIVVTMAQERPYNFALLTLGNSDHAYRYFLEVWGKPPTIIESPQKDPQRKTVTDQLIVVCEGGDCKPLGHPLWEVAGFGRGEIVEREVGPAGIIIYKLIHYTGE